MGLFPHTIGKRFRAPGQAPLGGPIRDARAGSCTTLHLYPVPQDVVFALYASHGAVRA
jgi:hypothetical protein